MITCECIEEKGTMWGKCKSEKRTFEGYYAKRHMEIPKWECKFPFPGANFDSLDWLTSAGLPSVSYVPRQGDFMPCRR